MLIAVVFAVSFMLYGVAGKSSLAKNEVQIPCYLGTYDLDGDGEISPEEFFSATRGFTKMDPKTLFERLDKNSDSTITIEEFTHVDPSLRGAGIIGHCRRRRCWGICINIGISIG